MQPAKPSGLRVVLYKYTVIPWGATIPRLDGADALVVHPADTANVTGGIENSACRVIHENPFMKLWTLVKDHGSRVVGVKLRKEEFTNESVELGLANMRCKLMNVSGYLSD
jgi:hypothetical protein